VGQQVALLLPRLILMPLFTSVGKRGFKHYFSTNKIEVDYESPLLRGSHCWIWLGAQFPDGYGKIQYKNGKGWIPLRSQKYFWHLYRGPTSLDVSHFCHRRLCVNLRHLHTATHTDNMRQQFQDQYFNEDQMSQVRGLLHEGFTISYIADKMQSPRLYIAKLARTTDWRTLDLFD
jgi:hypothetical protein